MARHDSSGAYAILELAVHVYLSHGRDGPASPFRTTRHLSIRLIEVNRPRNTPAGQRVSGGDAGGAAGTTNPETRLPLADVRFRCCNSQMALMALTEALICPLIVLAWDKQGSRENEQRQTIGAALQRSVRSAALDFRATPASD